MCTHGKVSDYARIQYPCVVHREHGKSVERLLEASSEVWKARHCWMFFSAEHDLEIRSHFKSSVIEM
ncbi:uncharacterized protein PHALS_05819 [Plasmopara halstedii]|uniref:Uncharacterized protein n=1 Tax=Plasmopara halstedii TaxID=4781 RepID=A0A0P1ABJ0_PLAHL|nr:uncharacterized protein PHALS_05819 [Plasmopara halstedii]CEG37764.1 hypothetical protein PHALS_05819 [Plasmopara halstedii]|eukprot:XP_024574133.1 hypothetical protein PHALS_05819 [Plasmopara halstedii]